MGRVACVDVPALPLQLLCAGDGEGSEHPVAVVDRDHPQGRILWVNERARRLGILPGQRYAAGLSLARDLRAGVVAAEEITCGVRELTKHLRRFTPEVEPSEEEPGVFWLGAGGLERLWPSASHWADALYTSLTEAGFVATVAVAFSRFGSYAMARSRRGVVVFRDAAGEQSAIRTVPLARLGLDPKLRDALAKLGVHTVGALCRLPAAGLLERFGSEVHRLHRMASGTAWTPLEPAEAEEPLEAARELDHPERDLNRLVFGVKILLDPLLDGLARRGQLLRELEIGLRQEIGGWRHERLRPARPTLAGAQLLELVRLRFERAAASRSCGGQQGVAPHPAPLFPIEEISVRVQGVPARFEQLHLFVENPHRDLAAAGRALARLRAEFGPEAVVHARLRDGHLPEAKFFWEPIEALPASRGRVLPRRILVRRMRRKALLLPPRPRHLCDDGWLIRGLEPGPVMRLAGPYIVAGGWWVRSLRREYYFAHTERGDLLWLYYDGLRRRWFQQGQIE